MHARDSCDRVGRSPWTEADAPVRLLRAGDEFQHPGFSQVIKPSISHFPPELLISSSSASCWLLPCGGASVVQTKRSLLTGVGPKEATTTYQTRKLETMLCDGL